LGNGVSGGGEAVCAGKKLRSRGHVAGNAVACPIQGRTIDGLSVRRLARRRGDFPVIAPRHHGAGDLSDDGHMGSQREYF